MSSKSAVWARAGVVAELTSGAEWRDSSGGVQPLTLDEILIVAPYDAQVGMLLAATPGAHVGTVDKFLGQEAPVVIYSMATSSAEDAPRGMSFLYSRNRLNVATSRAQCAAILVASPGLFRIDCRTPEQIRLANGFLRYLELAEWSPSIRVTKQTWISPPPRQPIAKQEESSFSASNERPVKLLKNRHN